MEIGYYEPRSSRRVSTRRNNSSNSPIRLKRSSIIHYKESIPFVDDNDAVNKQDVATITSDEIKNSTQGSKTIFNSGSISSLKLSAVQSHWPSTDYHKLIKERNRTHSNCDRNRTLMNDKSSCLNQTCETSSIKVKTNGEICRNLSSSFSNSSSLQHGANSNHADTIVSDLSGGDNQSKLRATDTMRTMKFTNVSLIEALRLFTLKIPIVGESQERERILSHFTKCYMECNPTFYKDFDSCHTLVCALILLNTDLHSQISRKKMSCEEFVNNILTNYPDNGYNQFDLKSMYQFIKKNELKFESSSNQNSQLSNGSNTLRRKFAQLIQRTPNPNHNSKVIVDFSQLNQQTYISGNIMRKCLYQSFGKKPPIGHRGWKLQYASVVGLQFLLFKTNLNQGEQAASLAGSIDDLLFDKLSVTGSSVSSDLIFNDEVSSNSGIISRFPSHAMINPSLSTGTTPRYASPYIGSNRIAFGQSGIANNSNTNFSVSSLSPDDISNCLRLHHALACVQPESQKPIKYFSLHLADQSVYCFKVKKEEIQSWVNNINYAAALQSASPILAAGKTGVYKPLMPPYITDKNKEGQIQSHREQIRFYQESLERLMNMESKSHNINIENEMKFCKFEINRFQLYVNILSIDGKLSETSVRLESNNSNVGNNTDLQSSSILLNPVDDACLTLRKRPPLFNLTSGSGRYKMCSENKQSRQHQRSASTSRFQCNSNNSCSRVSLSSCLPQSFSRFIDSSISTGPSGAVTLENDDDDIQSLTTPSKSFHCRIRVMESDTPTFNQHSQFTGTSHLPRYSPPRQHSYQYYYASQNF